MDDCNEDDCNEDDCNEDDCNEDDCNEDRHETHNTFGVIGSQRQPGKLAMNDICWWHHHAGQLRTVHGAVEPPNDTADNLHYLAVVYPPPEMFIGAAHLYGKAQLLHVYRTRSPVWRGPAPPCL